MMYSLLLLHIVSILQLLSFFCHILFVILDQTKFSTLIPAAFYWIDQSISLKLFFPNLKWILLSLPETNVYHSLERQLKTSGPLP